MLEIILNFHVYKCGIEGFFLFFPLHNISKHVFQFNFHNNGFSGNTLIFCPYLAGIAGKSSPGLTTVVKHDNHCRYSMQECYALSWLFHDMFLMLVLNDTMIMF